MINKIYKRLFNRYSNIFKFLFFLKYLFLIFFISLSTYLLFPKFINYSEKKVYIKKYLLQNYNLNIINFENVKYNAFPLPYLEINNSTLNFYQNNYKIDVKKIRIFLKIVNIYDFQKLSGNKISLIDSKLKLKEKYIKSFYKSIISQKNRINVKNLIIEIINDKKDVIKLTNIDYSNYGYKKNKLSGKVFNKKFKIDIKEKLQKISFKIPSVGIIGEIYFENNISSSVKIGKFKGKLLNSKVKLDFRADNKVYYIGNFFFRNKNLSFKSDGKIIFNPFLSIDLKSHIKEIDKALFYKINIKKLLENKDLLKRLNTNQVIDFTSKKFSRGVIKNLNLKFSLAYGKIVLKKNVLLDEGEISCNNEMNLIDDNPILIFDCIIISNNVKKFLKNFSLEYKKKDESLNLKIKGNLNLFQKKINFLNVQRNNSYKASEYDLKFFKEVFEDNFLDDNSLDIFSIIKINQFIKKVL